VSRGYNCKERYVETAPQFLLMLKFNERYTQASCSDMVEQEALLREDGAIGR
jgi:hypothetical protein